jgi:hypothetical protein
MATGLRNNHSPSELPTLMAPRLIELCFQTAGIWEMGVQGRMGLPQHIDQISMSLHACDLGNLNQARLYAVVTPDADQASFDAEVMDADGNLYLQFSGYRTVALPDAVDAERLKALHALMSGEVLVAV